MAMDTIPGATPVCKNTVDLGPVEDASADLFVADVLVTATESFVRETKAWLEYGRLDGAKQSLMELDTMLGELRDKIALAKGKVDGFVDDTFAARRKAA
jgi:hypothetical protein